jgi:hypothetical protein
MELSKFWNARRYYVTRSRQSQIVVRAGHSRTSPGILGLHCFVNQWLGTSISEMPDWYSQPRILSGKTGGSFMNVLISHDWNQVRLRLSAGYSLGFHITRQRSPKLVDKQRSSESEMIGHAYFHRSKNLRDTWPQKEWNALFPHAIHRFQNG